MSHKGPVCGFTQCCDACGKNIWDTDICIPFAEQRRKRVLDEQKKKRSRHHS